MAGSACPRPGLPPKTQTTAGALFGPFVVWTSGRGLQGERLCPSRTGRIRAGGTQRITLGPDKGYDRREFVQALRDKNVPPNVARKRKGSAINGPTTRHAGHAMSIHARRRIESIFGWMKTIGGMRKIRFRGLGRVGLHFSIAATDYNTLRIARLGVV